MLRTGRIPSVDGTPIAFSEWGNPRGPAVVLIHGWIFSQLAFERQKQGELAERCRVVAYDLRGHGESGKPEDPSAYSDSTVWAADLDHVLRAVGIERPLLCGWSLGGRVAAHYVYVRGRKRVAGLNLVSSRVLQPPGASVNGTTSVGPEICSESLAESIPITAAFVRNCTLQSLNREHEELLLGTAMTVSPVARRGASAWHIEYGSYFDELDMPTLVTHGGSDSMTVPLAAQNIAQRLRCELSIFPSCGHMPFWELPERFNHELAEFSERIS